MKKRFIFKKLVLLAALSAVFLAGCKKEAPDVSYVKPTGLWASGNDGFEVKSSPDQFYYYCDNSKSIALAGNITQVIQEGSSGYWVIEITQNNTICGPWNMDYGYFVVGKFTVVKWKDMNASGLSVKQSTAYKNGSGLGAESYNSSTEAVSALVNSVNANSTYFGMINTSVYNKQ